MRCNRDRGVILVALAALAACAPAVLASPAAVKAPRQGPIDRRANSSTFGTNLVPNIVNGVAAGGQSVYPFMAFVSVGGYMCGGSLVAPNLLVTAAHCAYQTQPSDYLISTYRYDMSSTTAAEGGIDYTVSKIYIHPLYDTNENPYDLAVLVLNAPVNYGSFKPAFISLNRDPNYPPKDTMARVIGWGVTKTNGDASDILLQVDIPTTDATTCKTVLNGDGGTPSELCAGSQGKDSCQGDSGGPLMVKQSNGQWLQIGAVSYGTQGCASPTAYLGVYARISYFTSWLDGIFKTHAPGYLPKSTTKKVVVVKTTSKKPTTKKGKVPTTKKGSPVKTTKAVKKTTTKRKLTTTKPPACSGTGKACMVDDDCCKLEDFCDFDDTCQPFFRKGQSPRTAAVSA